MAAPPKTQVFTVIVVSDHSQAVRKFRRPAAVAAERRLRRRRRRARRAPHGRPLLRPARRLLRERGPQGGERAAPLADPARPGEGRAHLGHARPGRAVRREAPDRGDAAPGPRAEPRHRPGRRARRRTPRSRARRPRPRRTSPPCPGKLSLARDRGVAPGAEPARAAGVLRRPALAARLDAVHLADARLGDLRLRHAHRPVHGRAEDAPGLDIATPHGQAVYSPSDGTVVFAGTRGRVRQGPRHRPRLRREDPLRPPLRDQRPPRRPREARRQGGRGREHRALHRARTSTTRCA